jgi:hypothetical protein
MTLTKQEQKEMKRQLKLARPFYKKKRTWFGAFVALVIISSIANGGGDSGSPKKVDQTENKKATQAVAKEDKGFYIGDSVKTDDIIFKVNSVKEASSVGSDLIGEKAQGKYVIVDLNITNGQKEAVQFLEDYFTLSEKDGTTYEYATTAGIYANEAGHSFFLAKINPKITMNGKVVFDIPKEINTKDLTLKAQTGVFGTHTVKIKLTNK